MFSKTAKEDDTNLCLFYIKYLQMIDDGSVMNLKTSSVVSMFFEIMSRYKAHLTKNPMVMSYFIIGLLAISSK